MSKIRIELVTRSLAMQPVAGRINGRKALLPSDFAIAAKATADTTPATLPVTNAETTI